MSEKKIRAWTNLRHGVWREQEKAQELGYPDHHDPHRWFVILQHQLLLLNSEIVHPAGDKPDPQLIRLALERLTGVAWAWYADAGE